MKKPLLTMLSMIACVLLFTNTQIFAQFGTKCDCAEPSGKPSEVNAYIPKARFEIDNGDIVTRDYYTVYTSMMLASSDTVSLIEASGIYKQVTFKEGASLIIDAEYVEFETLDLTGVDQFTLYIKKDATLQISAENPFKGKKVNIFNDGTLTFTESISLDKQSVLYNTDGLNLDQSLTIADASVINAGDILGGRDYTRSATMDDWDDTLILKTTDASEQGRLQNCGRIRLHTSANVQNGGINNCCTFIVDGKVKVEGSFPFVSNFGTLITSNFTLVGDETNSGGTPTLNLDAFSKLIVEDLTTTNTATGQLAINVDGDASIICQKATFKKRVNHKNTDAWRYFKIHQYTPPTASKNIELSIFGLIDSDNKAGTCAVIYGDDITSSGTNTLFTDSVISIKDIHEIPNGLLENYYNANFKRQVLEDADGNLTTIETRLLDIYAIDSEACNQRLICLQVEQCGTVALDRYRVRITDPINGEGPFTLERVGIGYDLDPTNFDLNTDLTYTDGVSNTPFHLTTTDPTCPDVSFDLESIGKDGSYFGFKLENITYLTGNKKGGNDCETAIIDFENFEAGYTGGNKIAFADGFIASNSPDGNTAKSAMIFNSTMPTGGDRDLKTPSTNSYSENFFKTNTIGNIAIISEDGDSDDPDDNARGGTLYFNFDCDVMLDSLTWVDQDNELKITFKDEMGTILYVYTINETIVGAYANGNNRISRLKIPTFTNNDKVRVMEAKFAGSGGIDDIRYVKCNAPKALKPLTICFQVATDQENTKDAWDDFDIRIGSYSADDAQNNYLGCNWEPKLDISCEEDEEFVLPVQLLSFHVQSYQEDAVIDWKTASETNSSHFEIERSQHGIYFEKLTELKGKGNSEVIQHYQFLDHEPLEGYSYYRIKFVDNGGHYNYSSVEAFFKQNTDNTEPNVYPMPATDVLNFSQIEAFSDNRGELYLYNLDGKLITSKALDENFKQLDISELNHGLYIIELRNPTQRVMLKFTK